MKRYTLTAVLIMGVSTDSLAESALESCRRQLFEHADVNSDGVLTPNEAAAQPLGLDSKFFALADKNRDRVLDRQEYDKLGVFMSCEVCPAAPGCKTW